LSREQRKHIAACVGFLKPAFVEKSNVADFRVTFFTPQEEINLCGHATIAVYTVLHQKGFCTVGDYTQELKVGILHVEVKNGGFVLMDQTRPVFSEPISRTELRACIRSNVSFGEIEPQIVSTGVRDIFLQVETCKVLTN
jgi:PhzF family phenazine biosynthesis protein